MKYTNSQQYENSHRCKNFEKYSNSVRYEGGMSILEILIAIGVISFICIPSIQIIHSLQSTYILDIVEDLPSKNVMSVKYHKDGGVRTAFKKGGMRETHDVSQDGALGGVFNGNTCSDFYQDFDKSNTPTLHLYTSDELGISSFTLLTGLSFVGNSLLVSADSASTSLPDLYTFNIDIPIYSSKTPFSASSPESGDTQSMSPKPVLSMSLAEDTGPGISQIQSHSVYIFTSNTGVKNQANILKVNLAFSNSTPENAVTDNVVDGNIVDSISKALDLVIPGSNSSTTPITKTIVYADGKVFVGTEKSVFPEISIFNAQTGQLERSIEIGYGVNDMLLANDLLIVAGPRDPEIEVFSVVTLQKVGEYDLPGGSGNAKVLNLFGDYLHVGRTKGGDEFVILKLHRRDSNLVFSFVPMFTPVFNYKVKWSVDSILKSEQYSMLFTADEYFEFQLFENLQDIHLSFGVGDVEAYLENNLLYKVDLPDRVSSAVCMKNSIWMTFRNTDGTNSYRLGVLVFE